MCIKILPSLYIILVYIYIYIFFFKKKIATNKINIRIFEINLKNYLNYYL